MNHLRIIPTLNKDYGHSLPTLKYHAEIDGLRAIAVLSVVLFHAGFNVFQGGFIGVDVFFVISGYLITTIVLTEKQQGIFSLLNFYERRARRILPALFFVMLTCLPFAWFLMLPDQLIDFSKSLEAVSTFVANIYFWINTGYFSNTILEKPLVHMWSLGIEEQYYVLFPLMIILFWKIGIKKLITLVITVLIISLFMSEYSTRYHPSAAFFLMPTRAWELLVGSALAFMFLKKLVVHHLFSPLTNQIICLCGLMLVILPIFFFNENTSFPGLHALVPVLGTALIMVFSHSEMIVSNILSFKYIVKVGLISYSVYLWHQPLFAFARILYVNKISAYVMALLCLSCVILGYITWRYIEKPFRDKKYFERWQIFLISIAGVIFFSSVGAIGYYKKGFPTRLSVNQQALYVISSTTNYKELFNQNIRCLLNEDEDKTAFGNCTFFENGTGHVFLWGDSHAAHLYPGLKTINRYHKLTQLTASACPPIVDLDFGSERPKRPFCKDINSYILARIKREHPDKVILAARWGMRGDTWMLLKNTILKLQEFGIKDIVIIGPAPIWDDLLPHILARFNIQFSKLPERLQTHLLTDNYVLDQKMQNLANSLGVNYISLFSILCNDDGCLIKLGKSSSQIVSFDDGHLTEAGSKYVISKLPASFWKV